MTPSAILLGSIGSLAEMSDMQRHAFNAAFAEAGLDWVWEREPYFKLLEKPGGAQRIADYAAARGERVDARAIHAAKVRHFERMVREQGIEPRPGVTDLLAAARRRGIKTAFVTATTPDTVGLVLGGLSPRLTARDFDLITDISVVEAGKPDPAVYRYALKELGVPANAVLAVEDTPETAQAAIAAGIATLGFPNAACAGRAFPGVRAVVDTLDPGLLDTDLTRAA